MSSNVGLTTPRGSGTSGYVQRNTAFMKPRNTGYGAPYPPVSGANGPDRPFKQRVPDKQILEHDRKRAIEVQVMEERDRLEEENERIEEEMKKKGKNAGKVKKEEGETEAVVKSEPEEERVLEDEEIDERCEALRQRLLSELEVEMERGERKIDRRNLKSYRVHELAEAKIEETERLRRAFGLKEDRETGEITGSRERRRD
ncbi:unnamed protein product [Penicillium salamii]|uniref:CWF21 domain-containing protein n=1 Tax=Penicillium salamii TaxID=1612424 RepID=A0A9W4NJJ7_9EURO|nr:unnamed protein product [Penicillium salamii]